MATSLEHLNESYGNDSNGGGGAAEVWKTFFKEEADKPEEALSPEKLSQRYEIAAEREHRDEDPQFRHAIVGLPGTESCFLKQAITYDVSDWESEEVAATKLMLQYLTDRMYNQIRGQGWTYGIGVYASVNSGTMTVSFYRASDLVPAYKEFRKIIANYSSVEEDGSSTVEWDPVLLDSARGSLIYGWVATEETVGSLASASVSAYLRQQDDPFFARRFVSRLSRVTVEDVERVAQKYLPRFFDTDQTYTSAVCSPKEVEDVKTLFEGFDFNLVQIDDLEDSILTEP